MTPQGDRGHGGGQREGEGGGVPEVEHRKQHHPTEEEGRKHQETVDDIHKPVLIKFTLILITNCL